jgi:hypothetical protein
MKSIAGAIVVLGGAYLIGIATSGRELLSLVVGGALIVIGLGIIFGERGQK